MEAVPLLLSLGALAIVSMDLALSIIWNRRARYSWSRTCIVFTASLMGAVVAFVLAQYSSYAFSGQAREILLYIWESLLVADSTFILAMLPFFACWIVARPMHPAEKVLSTAVACIYLAVSVSYTVFGLQVLSLLQYLIWAAVAAYCIVIALAFSRNVADKSVQLMCRTLAIISLSLMPLLILTCIYAWLRDAVIAVVAMAYSIAILVFLFIATAHQESASADARKEPLSSEIIQERYHITDRELEVIRLIKKGCTNKEIAYELSISVNTVNNHIANIFGKTEVRSRIDLLNLLQEASW